MSHDPSKTVLNVFSITFDQFYVAQVISGLLCRIFALKITINYEIIMMRGPIRIITNVIFMKSNLNKKGRLIYIWDILYKK